MTSSSVPTSKLSQELAITQTIKESPSVAVLALVVFLLPAIGYPSALIVQDTLKSTIAALGILSATWAFFWQQRNRPQALQWHPVLCIPLALLCYAVGSMAWSHAYLAGVEAVRWLLFGTLLWTGFNALTRQNLPNLLWSMHWGTCVASLWTALQFWFDLQLFPQGAQPASTFFNRNFFAEYAICVLPVSVYLLANTRRHQWRNPVALSIALNVTAILMTGTRSALSALVITAPFLVLALVRYRDGLGWIRWTTRQQAQVAGVLLLGIAGMGLLPSGSPQIGLGLTPFAISSSRSASVATVIRGNDESVSVRMELWKATARMVMAHPWTGVGAGNLEVEIPLYQRTETGAEIDAYAHNEYLQLLSEYGLPLGGLVLAVALAWFIQSTGHLLLNPSHDDAAVIFMTIGTWALMLVAGAGFPFHLATCTVFLAIALAVIAKTTSVPRVIHLSASLRRYCLLGMGIGVAICIAAIAVATYVERMYTLTGQELMSALRNPQTKAEKVASAKNHLTQALALHPHYAKLQHPIAAELVELGEWELALTTTEALAASRPNAPDQWFNLAILRAKLGDYTGSAYALERLEALQPMGLRNVKARVDLLTRMGEYDKARMEEKKLLFPNNP